MPSAGFQGPKDDCRVAGDVFAIVGKVDVVVLAVSRQGEVERRGDVSGGAPHVRVGEADFFRIGHGILGDVSV